ncbi:LysR family transcriptional regulator [Methylovirgula sp. 4M-Z18]|uniref:LysR family transcriptional regulator n=1 Tax=Methylovirgula sp. 4M-Z18 TaxID=2293567 RepID=UPI001314D043
MFSEIVKSNSFSLAASKLGLSPATMSGRLKALECHFGVSLLKRTTRSLCLTEEGRYLFETSQGILDDFERLDKTMRARRKNPNGTVTIAAPSEFGRKYLIPLTNEFGAAHPEIGFRLILGDDDVNIVDDDCDIVIRFGPVPDSALTTRKLGENPMVVCASPDYLARAGMPEMPADLAAHNCLVYLDGKAAADKWAFEIDGEATIVRVRGNRLVSDRQALIDLAKARQGLIRVSSWDVARELEDGTLVAVLRDFERDPEIIHLLSESRHRLPLRTVEFINFLLQRVKRLSRSAEHCRSEYPRLPGAA